jgi:hypothetical protein
MVNKSEFDLLLAKSQELGKELRFHFREFVVSSPHAPLLEIF